MDPQQLLDRWPEAEPTAAAEALRRIVEVFRSGHAAAGNLRHTADGLTPGQLRSQLETIEKEMLSEITQICGDFQIKDTGAARN